MGEESKVIDVRVQGVALPNDAVQLLQMIVKELIVIKRQGVVALEEVELVPVGYQSKTSTTPSTPTTMLKNPTKVSHFVFQNQGTTGTDNINIGTNSQRPISVAPGANLLISLSLVNYVIDLKKLFVDSATSEQPYGILVFE